MSLLERIPPERIRRSKSNNLHTTSYSNTDLYRSSDQSINQLINRYVYNTLHHETDKKKVDRFKFFMNPFHF